MSIDAATLEQGYASAREVTRHHAKSFYFSSAVLFGVRRRGAFALYAFCRRLDDLIDEAGADSSAASLPAKQGEGKRELLSKARAMVHALFERGEVHPIAPWPAAELHALLDTTRRFRIPITPFLDLIDGMEMDLEKSRYASWTELDLYCHRVAGVVGLMMAPLLGTTDPQALRHADDLGKAMQLTNILRDVKEDLARGRVYLPQDELAAAGVTEAQLAAGKVTPQLETFIRQQISRARSLYASAALGVPWLTGFGSQRVVRLMGSIYGGILDVIEARQLDVFTARASTSKWNKLWRLVKVMVTPNPPSRRLTPALPALGQREGEKAQ